jgi:DNA-binding transcriptional MerR regulator
VTPARRRTIGEFSRLSRLTVHTLRHYDDIGLLRPAAVDPLTGYRSYDDAQLPWALQLGVLRSVGMPLGVLQRIGTGELALADALAGHRRRLLEEIGDRQRALELVDALAGAGTPALTPVEVVTVPARAVWAARANCDWARIEASTRHALARLTVAARRAGRRVEARGALFPVEPAEHLVVVAFVDVDGAGAEGGDDRAGSGPPPPFERLAIGGGTALVIDHVGDHGLLGYAYRALVAELGRRGVDEHGAVAREEYGVGDDGRPSTRVSITLPG